MKLTFRFLTALFFMGLIFNSCDNKPELTKNTSDDYLIIPKPKSLSILDGRFTVDGNTLIEGAENLKNEKQYLAQMLKVTNGGYTPTEAENRNKIVLKIEDSITHDEGYHLNVRPDNITISGKTNRGVFYGLQTLQQLIKLKDSTMFIPAVSINDAPNFGYRGMHLDVCRHFFSTDFIKQYIDLLAMHKMNTFHWHLTEDQGWRIEIKKYPELTQVGAWRNGTIEGHFPGTANDNKRYGGFYTQEEIKDIIAYASARHITIIPEIELPGHSSAAIAAYPYLSCFPEEPSLVPNNMMSDASKKMQADGQPKIVQETWGVFADVYCAGKEETFEFAENVLSEVMALFPSEYIHIGGDECPKGNWERCPNCQKRMQELGLKDEMELQSYFITRIEKYVNSKGKNIIGWDEILEGGLAPNATVMSWRGSESGIEASKENHNVIMSPNTHCYFDHYQHEDKDNEPLAIGGFLPVEKVYTFNPIPEILEASQHHYILGGQANLWTEYIDSEDKAEYMLLPRMTALSETLWSSIDSRDWDDFKSRLKHFRHIYDDLGVNYAKHVFETDESE